VAEINLPSKSPFFDEGTAWNSATQGARKVAESALKSPFELIKIYFQNIKTKLNFLYK
jgi:hypothetical protein